MKDAHAYIHMDLPNKDGAGQIKVHTNIGHTAGFPFGPEADKDNLEALISALNWFDNAASHHPIRSIEIHQERKA
jgi:hypothetical protein